MNILFCIYLILACLVCVAIIIWVIREIILDLRETPPVEEPVAPPEPEPEPEPTLDLAAIEEDQPIPEILMEPVVVEDDCNGVEVVDVVWKEHIGKNKVYRYAPGDTRPHPGDLVLVPTFDKYTHGAIARAATVQSEVYRIDPADLTFALKRVIRIVGDPADHPDA